MARHSRTLPGQGVGNEGCGEVGEGFYFGWSLVVSGMVVSD